MITQQDSTQNQHKPAGGSAHFWFTRFSNIYFPRQKTSENMSTNVFLSVPSKNAHASWESLRVQDLRERRRNHWDVSFQQAEQTVRGFPQSEAKECALNNLADRNMETSASSWLC